jgi:hypothetical protein
VFGYHVRASESPVEWFVGPWQNQYGEMQRLPDVWQSATNGGEQQRQKRIDT